MRIIEPSVDVLTPLSEESFLGAIERAGRTCYQSEKYTTENSAREFCQKRIQEGHEAMLEHAPSISVRFICDRGVSHELVRHRLFSFAQESTRYCNYGKKDRLTFILPSWIESGVGDYRAKWMGCQGSHDIDPYLDGSPESWWFWSCATAERAYLKLLAMGWKPQQARSVLPNSLKTDVVVTGNVREWRHFFQLRTDKPAHPQMRQVANMAFDIIQPQIPVLFDDIIPYRG